MKKAINLDKFQDAFFAGVVARCVEECINHYQERLVAIYVSGSVQRQEAVRGVSDIDLYIFVENPNESDRDWVKDQINDQLEAEFPDLAWWKISHPIDISRAPHNTIATDTEKQQMANRSLAYDLLCDSTLVFGEDVTKGLTLPPPDRSLARWGIALDPLILACYAAGLEPTNRSDFDLPNDPSLKLRKLARLAVIGGAYLMMSQGKYKSGKGADIFPFLIATQPEWADFLKHTQSIYITPISTTATEVREYAIKLVSWLEWVQEQVD